MSRQPWTETELSDLKSCADWPSFSALHPTRSYDSWEVKRRRAGGSAGTRVLSRADRVLAFKAAQALMTLADFVEAKSRG